MTFIVYIILFMQFSFYQPAHTMNTSIQTDSLKINPLNVKLDTLILRYVPNDAFHLGELLEYKVNFGSISAGYASLSIPEKVTINGRDCYHIISNMRTNDFFSTFFRVEDIVESFVDINGIFPWLFHKSIREGKYKTNRTAVFDHLRGTAFEGKKIITIPTFSQDVLSIFYFLRTLELQVGHPIEVDSYADKKYYPLSIQILKKEKIKVPAGKFDCYLVEPALRSGSIFEQKGKMWVWFSSDKRRLPVLIKSKINIAGSLSMELVNVRNSQTKEAL